jgi:hypothetical protein
VLWEPFWSVLVLPRLFWSFLVPFGGVLLCFGYVLEAFLDMFWICFDEIWMPLEVFF